MIVINKDWVTINIECSNDEYSKTIELEIDKSIQKLSNDIWL